MKHLKLYEEFNKTFKITYDLVDYLVKEIGKNTFEIDNFFGIDGIDILKRKNGFGETRGYYDSFEVTINEDNNKLEIKIDSELNDNIIDTFIEIIDIIGDHYDSVGWEFLNDPLK